MEAESTLGDIYEDLAERVALARSRALMGEREEALSIFKGASLEYNRFRDVLEDYPGCHALDYAFQVTQEALCEERESLPRYEEAPMEESQTVGKPRSRRRRAA